MKRLLEESCLHPNPGTVCFTGPRPKHIFPIQSYDPNRRTDYQKIADAVRERILSLYEDGYDLFLTGGAQGFDQLAFWAVHSAKKVHPSIRNIVVRPFEGQEKKWSKVGLFSQQEYQVMLRHADHILTCASLTDHSRKDAAEALQYRNQIMVTLSQVVVGMGEPEDWEQGRIYGGTGNCLRYAKEKQKQILVQSFRSFLPIQ